MSPGAPRYRRKTISCLCRFCKQPFLAADARAVVCEQDECQRAKRREGDRRRKAAKAAARRRTEGE